MRHQGLLTIGESDRFSIEGKQLTWEAFGPILRVPIWVLGQSAPNECLLRGGICFLDLGVSSSSTRPRVCFRMTKL